MRVPILLLAVALAVPSLNGQEELKASATEKLKDSIREWIETNREIQKLENDWDRDREVLQAHRDGLDTEIEELQEQIEEVKGRKGEADDQSVEAVKTYDALKAANESLEERLPVLEAAMLEKIGVFPPPLLEEPRVAQMISDLKATTAKDKESKGAINGRLNVVLNLLAEADKFQTNITRNDEVREVSDGRKLKIRMLYFGLAVAYGVDESGEVAFVGRPGPEGWDFTENKDLAPDVTQLMDVMNGDRDATFTSLPIELP